MRGDLAVEAGRAEAIDAVDEEGRRLLVPGRAPPVVVSGMDLGRWLLLALGGGVLASPGGDDRVDGELRSFDGENFGAVRVGAVEPLGLGNRGLGDEALDAVELNFGDGEELARDGRELDEAADRAEMDDARAARGLEGALEATAFDLAGDVSERGPDEVDGAPRSRRRRWMTMVPQTRAPPAATLSKNDRGEGKGRDRPTVLSRRGRRSRARRRACGRTYRA